MFLRTILGIDLLSFSIRYEYMDRATNRHYSNNKIIITTFLLYFQISVARGRRWRLKLQRQRFNETIIKFNLIFFLV